MKFDVGKIVRIKADLIIDKDYFMDNGTDFDSFAPDMAEYRGNKAIITEITSCDEYHVDIDKGQWSWTDEMFE